MLSTKSLYYRTVLLLRSVSLHSPSQCHPGLISGQLLNFFSRNCSLLFVISKLLGRDGSSSLHSRPDTYASSVALLKVVFSISDNVRLPSTEWVGSASLTTPNVYISDRAMTSCFSSSSSTELLSFTLNPLYGDIYSSFTR